MVNFFTFCVDIHRHSREHLLKGLNFLVKSLEKNTPNYHLIVYTNFEIPVLSTKVEIRPYYNNSIEVKYQPYSDPWLNLSFNKINLYKDLKCETGVDYTWVDLDTIICSDVSYVNELEHFFLETGGNNLELEGIFPNNPKYNIQRKNYIQGNVWKLNDNLYDVFYATYNRLISEGLIPRFDLQDVFNYIIHFDTTLPNPIILGKTYKPETINGLAVWSKEGNTHGTVEGLQNLYADDKGLIKSNFYPDKEIHFLSFTFATLNWHQESEAFKAFITKVTTDL